MSEQKQNTNPSLPPSKPLTNAMYYIKIHESDTLNFAHPIFRTENKRSNMKDKIFPENKSLGNRKEMVKPAKQIEKQTLKPYNTGIYVTNTVQNKLRNISIRKPDGVTATELLFGRHPRKDRRNNKEPQYEIPQEKAVSFNEISIQEDAFGIESNWVKMAIIY